MSKGLITLIGLVVSLGVVALGFFAVALPMYLQSVTVDGQTSTVAATNAIYQAQVDSLRAEEENLDEITATVAGLRAQIPAVGQLDDVFELVAQAAASSQASIVSVTAGSATEFAQRTAVEDLPDAPAASAPGAEVEEGTGTEGAAGEESSVPPAPGAEGRQQIDFAIQVTADDMAQATAFLDALRAGPRLLSSIQSTSVEDGEGRVNLTVTALTYLAEG